MNVFVDANISDRLSRMLAIYCENKHNIVHITEHPDFTHNNDKRGSNNTPDIEWIRKLGASREEWKVLTAESDIIDTAHERAALIESGLTLFSFDKHWDDGGFPAQGWKIIKVWGEIERHAMMPGPALYRVNMRKLSLEVIGPGMRARGGKFRGQV